MVEKSGNASPQLFPFFHFYHQLPSIIESETNTIRPPARSLPTFPPRGNLQARGNCLHICITNPFWCSSLLPILQVCKLYLGLNRACKSPMESMETPPSCLGKAGKGRRIARASSSKEGKKRKKISSSSSPSTNRWQYEVFLSFYGEDTRKGFTDHLYAALQRKGILTFRDDEKLQRGKCIGPGLLKAIQESIYAIVVLSHNYASSKWCLIELVKIVKCMREKETILPVFYHVDPSAVRKQTDSFAQAFDKHEKDPEVDMKQIQTWRDALTQVANISGWHIQDWHESIMIQKISETIFNQLNNRFSVAYGKLAGIDSRVKETMNIFGVGLNDVRFIGIHGMGGVGKTTLSEVIYDRVSNNFEARCFIASVREAIGNPGLVSLQKQLLSQILKETEIQIFNVHQGTKIIWNRLRNRRVFIVLDDVDNEDQLEALAGGHDWFGPGSRIIFTSRDTHLLKSHGGKDIYLYEVKGLNHNEALQLFSLSAFKQPYPEENYLDMSKGFVDYAQGLPLALKILGSSLFGRTKDAWKSAWDDLQANPNRRILDILQISFDGLKDSQKNLFLDIACFFHGEVLDNVLYDILESFRYYPGINISVLEEKSLASISRGRLIMHDLLRKMGRDIIHRESPKEPGLRSRLWCWDDVLHILKNNTGTDAVEGIVLNLPLLKEKRLSVEGFSRMTKLRILKIGTISVVRNFSEVYDMLRTMEWLGDPLKSLSTNQLRIMELCGYPLENLPTNLQLDNLIKLSMQYSSIRKLWAGTKSLSNLKGIDLRWSEHLIEIPDLSGAPNLERLNLEGCKKLAKVHPDIGVHKRLKELILGDCKSLESLSEEINLESVKVINLRDCSRFKKFPDIVGNMTSLEHLLLDGTAIKELPASLKSLSRLSELTLKYCKNLSVLPSVVCGLSSLRVLYVSGCKRLEKFPDLSNMECLQDFQAKGTAIAQLPSPSLFPKNIKRIVVGGYKDFPLDSGDLSFFDVSLSKRSSELINVSHFNFWSPSYISDACCINYCDNERRGCMVYLELERFIGEHEGFEGKSRGHERILGSAVAHGMPDWFTTRSSGSSVTLEMHQNLDGNRKWIGCALFVVYESHKQEDGNSWILESEDLIYQSFACDIETDEGRLGDFLLLQTPDVASVGPIGFWAFIPVEWFLDQSNNWEGWSYIRASIATDSLDPSTDNSVVEVKECGARLLYEGDALEFSNAVARGWHRAYYRFLSGHDFENSGDGMLPLPNSLAIKEM